MAAEVSAWVSAGTLLVIIVSALAAFVQLRHMSVLNGLTVLSDFNKEYERVVGAAVAALPLIDEHLEQLDARVAIADGKVLPACVLQAMPLLRLFEILGSYTNRKIVSHDLVTDMWAPVVVSWWEDLAPLIVVMRRAHGPTLFENWEAIVVRSKRSLNLQRSGYPKRLPHLAIVDPWPDDPNGRVSSRGALDA